MALRYQSRLRRWNLDYMVEAFDAILGRHSSILGPWITVTRTGDRDDGDGPGGAEIVSIEIHSEIELPYRGRVKETVLDFRRDGDHFTEVARFGASPSPELVAGGDRGLEGGTAAS